MSRRFLSVRNPRTGLHDYEIEVLDHAGIARMAERLRSAQREWSSLTLEQRGAQLLVLASALDRHRAAIAAALEADTGRRRIARIEIDGVCASIRGWVAAGPSLLPTGWTQGLSQPHIRHTAQFVPHSLIGVISPWNFPLTLSMIDTIPALLAGCCVIVKPSEVTPRFVAPMAEAIAEAGFADRLAFATGEATTGTALVEAVDAVCFTGSLATGRKVATQAAGRMIPAFLELGGKDPLIITKSADLQHASEAAFRGSVLSTGQACQSIERIYVHRSRFAALVQQLEAKAKAARFNWPDIAKGEIGPIIFDRQADILEDHITDAKEKGAKILTGGIIEHHGGGLWLAPTVMTNVDHSMKVMREETFGPILPVMAYDSEEEAIRLANDSEYGLSAAVFAGDLEEAERIARQLDAGAVSLNDAALTSLFHEAEKHAFKHSGMGGSRMGPAGLQRFLRRKALIANTGVPTPLSAFAEDAT